MQASICRRSVFSRKAPAFLNLTLLVCFLPSVSLRLPAQSDPKVHRKVVVMKEPEYPSILKNGHFEGQVRLAATVSPNGNVTKVEVRGGNPMLAEYALQAVMHWKYSPAPAQTVEDVVFNFTSH
jgi:TonB family protein